MDIQSEAAALLGSPPPQTLGPEFETYLERLNRLDPGLARVLDQHTRRAYFEAVEPAVNPFEAEVKAAQARDAKLEVWRSVFYEKGLSGEWVLSKRKLLIYGVMALSGVGTMALFLDPSTAKNAQPAMSGLLGSALGAKKDGPAAGKPLPFDAQTLGGEARNTLTALAKDPKAAGGPGSPAQAGSGGSGGSAVPLPTMEAAPLDRSAALPPGASSQRPASESLVPLGNLINSPQIAPMGANERPTRVTPSWPAFQPQTPLPSRAVPNSRPLVAGALSRDSQSPSLPSGGGLSNAAPVPLPDAPLPVYKSAPPPPTNLVPYRTPPQTVPLKVYQPQEVTPRMSVTSSAPQSGGSAARDSSGGQRATSQRSAPASSVAQPVRTGSSSPKAPLSVTRKAQDAAPSTVYRRTETRSALSTSMAAISRTNTDSPAESQVSASERSSNTYTRTAPAVSSAGLYQRPVGAAVPNSTPSAPGSSGGVTLYQRPAQSSSAASQTAPGEAGPGSAVTLYQRTSEARTPATPSTGSSQPQAATLYQRATGSAAGGQTRTGASGGQVLYQRNKPEANPREEASSRGGESTSTTGAASAPGATSAAQTEALIASLNAPASPPSSAAGFDAGTLGGGLRNSLSGPGAASVGAALGYTSGQALKAQLVTRVVTAEGAQVPTLALSQDGTLWIGSATLDNTRRMQVRFERAVRGADEFPITATAFSVDQQPGLQAALQDEAPSLVEDALRAGVGGVAGYAKNYLDALGKGTTVITSSGGVSTATNTPSPQGQGLLEAVGANVASLLALPSTSQTVIRTARVEQGTALLIYYGIKW